MPSTFHSPKLPARVYSTVFPRRRRMLISDELNIPKHSPAKFPAATGEPPSPSRNNSTEAECLNGPRRPQHGPRFRSAKNRSDKSSPTVSQPNVKILTSHAYLSVSLYPKRVAKQNLPLGSQLYTQLPRTPSNKVCVQTDDESLSKLAFSPIPL